MKTFLTSFLTLVFASAVFAEPPVAPRSGRYKNLYLKSAFTDPPLKEEKVTTPSDLPDWVLVGLSKYVDGVKVQLMNKKDRSRVTIPSREATEMGFAIEEVKQDRNFIDEAVVTIKKGNSVGDVRFDSQFLVLKSVGSAGGSSKNKVPGIPNNSKKSTRGSTSRRPPIPGSSRTNTPPLPGSVPKPSTTNRTSSSSKKPATRRRFIPTKK